MLLIISLMFSGVFAKENPKTLYATTATRIFDKNLKTFTVQKGESFEFVKNGFENWISVLRKSDKKIYSVEKGSLLTKEEIEEKEKQFKEAIENEKIRYIYTFYDSDVVGKDTEIFKGEGYQEKSYKSYMYFLKEKGGEKIERFIENYKRTEVDDKEEIKNILRAVGKLKISYGKPQVDGSDSIISQIQNIEVGKTKCAGYTWLLSRLFDKAGITYRIVGTRTWETSRPGGAGHVYTEVFFNGKWHNCDGTTIYGGIAQEEFKDKWIEWAFNCPEILNDGKVDKKTMIKLDRSIEGPEFKDMFVMFVGPAINSGKIIDGNIAILYHK